MGFSLFSIMGLGEKLQKKIASVDAEDKRGEEKSREEIRVFYKIGILKFLKL